MPMMRVCIRNERQSVVHQVMAQLHTTDPKVAVDWIIADWLSKAGQSPVTTGQPQAPIAGGLDLDVKDW